MQDVFAESHWVYDNPGLYELMQDKSPGDVHRRESLIFVW